MNWKVILQMTWKQIWNKLNNGFNSGLGSKYYM